MPISASLKPSTQQRPISLMLDDFSGGYNYEGGLFPLGTKESDLSYLVNWKFQKAGDKIKLRTRDGFVKASTSAAPAAIYAIGAYSLAGTSCVHVICDNDLMYLNGGLTGTLTKAGDLGTGTTSLNNMVNFNSKLIIADNAVLKSWDGTTVASLTDAPSAKFVIQKMNRIYANHVTYPNRLYYCNNNDPNDWTTTGGAGHIIFDGHLAITGLAVYLDEIIIFCNGPRAIYRMTGDTPDEYSIKKLYDGVSALGPKSIKQVGDDLIFKDLQGFVSLKRLMSYGDIGRAIIGKNFTALRGSLLSTASFAGAAGAFDTTISAKCSLDETYWVGGGSSSFYVYDPEAGAWTKFSLGIGTTVDEMGDCNGVTFIAGGDNHLYYYDYGVQKDNGVAYECPAKTGMNDINILQEKDARFADAVITTRSDDNAITETNSVPYDLKIYTDNNTTTPKKTLSLNTLKHNGPYQSPYCGHLNEVNFNFKQISFEVSGLYGSGGPHYLDRIVLEAAILSHY